MDVHGLAGIAAGLIAAYAIGCFSASYHVAKLVSGIDIRDFGSGTAGATNVGRLLGRKIAAAVALADILKGALAVWVATALSYSNLPEPLAMAAVVAGHIWPAQLRFRGGKGLAAGLGALIVVSPLAALLASLLNAALSLALRSTTLGAISATALTPFLLWLSGATPLMAVLATLPCAMVVFAHRSNAGHAYAAWRHGGGAK